MIGISRLPVTINKAPKYKPINAVTTIYSLVIGWNIPNANEDTSQAAVNSHPPTRDHQAIRPSSGQANSVTELGKLPSHPPYAHHRDGASKSGASDAASPASHGNYQPRNKSSSPTPAHKLIANNSHAFSRSIKPIMG